MFSCCCKLIKIMNQKANKHTGQICQRLSLCPVVLMKEKHSITSFLPGLGFKVFLYMYSTLTLFYSVLPDLQRHDPVVRKFLREVLIFQKVLGAIVVDQGHQRGQQVLFQPIIHRLAFTQGYGVSLLKLKRREQKSCSGYLCVLNTENTRDALCSGQPWPFHQG